MNAMAMAHKALSIQKADAFDMACRRKAVICRYFKVWIFMN